MTTFQIQDTAIGYRFSLIDGKSGAVRHSIVATGGHNSLEALFVLADLLWAELRVVQQEHTAISHAEEAEAKEERAWEEDSLVGQEE